MPRPSTILPGFLIAGIAMTSSVAQDTASAFESTGQLDCTYEAMIEPATCSFGVRRGENGGASVFVTTPDGEIRELVFAADGTVTVAGSDTATSLSRVGKSTFVMIFSGTEVYRVPDAVLEP